MKTGGTSTMKKNCSIWKGLEFLENCISVAEAFGMHFSKK